MTLVALTGLLSAASSARIVPDGSTFPHGFTERWTFMVAIAAFACLASLIVKSGLRLRLESAQLSYRRDERSHSDGSRCNHDRRELQDRGRSPIGYMGTVSSRRPIEHKGDHPRWSRDRNRHWRGRTASLLQAASPRESRLGAIAPFPAPGPPCHAPDAAHATRRLGHRPRNPA